MSTYRITVTTTFDAEDDNEALRIATDELWDGPTEVEVFRPDGTYAEPTPGPWVVHARLQVIATDEDDAADIVKRALDQTIARGDVTDAMIVDGPSGFSCERGTL